MRRILPLCLLLIASSVAADEPKKDDLAAKLKELADKPVLPKDFDAANMLARDVRARLKEANRRDIEAWGKIKTRADWEKFRDEKIAALKKSLGEFSQPPKDMKVRVTKTIEGEGYAVENTLFESRPGLWVSANLYRPARSGKSMPGILIVHSHHNPKEQGELQDMGVTWAKAGCYVLVMDQLGHGERRQHPFLDAKSYPGEFRVGRQDYYFRYNLGVQLSLIGDSLIGWMAWDLMRGVDLLLKKPGIDKEKIILLGSVAGGGDPAGVTAALDPRITCVVPFNFGGPQPETRYPLPEDAETSFNYVGGGSWESTRNLRNSARDGFLPWVIVASVAPRYLIHAHEFAWDRERDPVWKRYQKVWGFYDATDKLSFAHGVGGLVTKDPPGSHCNNIGQVHRKLIHDALAKWFGIKAVETKDRHTAEELRCWTEEVRKELKPMSALAVANSIAKGRAGDWSKILGAGGSASAAREIRSEKLGWAAVVQVDLTTDRDIHVPVTVLLPAGGGTTKPPVVVVVAQEGRARLIAERAGVIGKLLAAGVAVCLPDVRDTGETRPGSGRGRGSAATSISASALMLGSSILAEQVRDLSAVIAYLGERGDIDANRIALWGESFAAENESGFRSEVPHDAAKYPHIGEPGAGLLVSVSARSHREVRGVLSRGSLLNYASVIQSPFFYLTHDSVLVGALSAGDLVRAYAEIPGALRFEGPIDGLNRRLTATELGGAALLREIEKSRGGRATEAIAKYGSDAAVAEWFIKKLGG